MRLQSVIHAIYPPQCIVCDALTADDHGLCGVCWADTVFLSGLVCDTCGAALPGDTPEVGVQCDDCMTIARPWNQGRAVFAYSGVGRRLVLGLKHSDRTDLVPSVARWMVRRTQEMTLSDPVLVPVPLHWTRLVKRRYNQSAMLAQAMGALMQRPVCADALRRPKRTKYLDGHTREARFATLADAIAPNAKRASAIAGRQVLLVDDVMTSGATLAASAEAVSLLGATNVSIVTLARVAKEP